MILDEALIDERRGAVHHSFRRIALFYNHLFPREARLEYPVSRSRKRIFSSFLDPLYSFHWGLHFLHPVNIPILMSQSAHADSSGFAGQRTRSSLVADRCKKPSFVARPRGITCSSFQSENLFFVLGQGHITRAWRS